MFSLLDCQKEEFIEKIITIVTNNTIDVIEEKINIDELKPKTKKELMDLFKSF